MPLFLHWSQNQIIIWPRFCWHHGPSKRSWIDLKLTPHKFKNRKIMPYIAKTVSIKWAKCPRCRKYRNLALISWWQTQQLKHSNHRIIQWMKMLRWYSLRTCYWMWSKGKTYKTCYHMPKHISFSKYNLTSIIRTIIKGFSLLVQALTKASIISSSK